MRYYHTCTQVFTSITCHSRHNLMIPEFSQQILKKYPDIKCHKNSSRCSQVAPCGWTDMTKLIVIFHNFANVPKDGVLLNTQYCGWYACPVSLLPYIMEIYTRKKLMYEYTQIKHNPCKPQPQYFQSNNRN